MKCVKVENGIVVNSAMWESCPDGWVESDAGKGWTYENGVFSAPKAAELSDIELALQNEANAKSLRDASIDADIEMFGEIYQVDNISLTISKSEKIGATEDDSIMYRLRNNLYRETTLAELREIEIAMIVRERSAWDQFYDWDNGDKLSSFVVV